MKMITYIFKYDHYLPEMWPKWQIIYVGRSYGMLYIKKPSDVQKSFDSKYAIWGKM